MLSRYFFHILNLTTFKIICLSNVFRHFSLFSFLYFENPLFATITHMLLRYSVKWLMIISKEVGLITKNNILFYQIIYVAQLLIKTQYELNIITIMTCKIL